METMVLTLDITPEILTSGEKIYAAVSREVELSSQGDTVEEAKSNALEALELLMETASLSELERRLPLPCKPLVDVYTSRVEVPYGKTAHIVGV